MLAISPMSTESLVELWSVVDWQSSFFLPGLGGGRGINKNNKNNCSALYANPS